MTKDEVIKKKIAFISLGCDKNTVDSEKMMFLLSNNGFEFTTDISQAEIAIINTCAFIQSSKQESMNKILEVAGYKTQKLEKLIITGCMSQRYYDEVKQIEQVDEVVRIKNNPNIVNIVFGLYGLTDIQNKKIKNLDRILSTPSHYAFLKIADGCNNFCSYCTIPFIRGRYKSVPMECLIDEAKYLAKSGVKELILVAQDVTNYGADLYGKPELVDLLKELSKIKGIEWIRLHYCYPHLITDELLNEISSNPKICKYLDIPLQHISNNILASMNRKDTKESITSLLDKIALLPNKISIRSTFIVGYPGERTRDFNELIEFLKKYRLDNVGFFTYSREKNTKAYKMPHQIFEFVKKSRLRKIEKVQSQIMLENQQAKVGKNLNCICEELIESENGIFVYQMRSEYNSVDVDTYTFVSTQNRLQIGGFYPVKITGTQGIDLVGEI